MAELRQRLRENDADDGETKEGTNSHLLSTCRWIYKTILAKADVLEGKAHNGYGQCQSERWFELHVWKMVDDYILYDVDIRGELTSAASSFRKNGATQLGIERKKIGRVAYCHENRPL
ncbi:hypothetical protein BGZ72_008050 [Mortierella alpina]|nr:hypothetical protein BGZ72_008050 [Mortierella alpina]